MSLPDQLLQALQEVVRQRPEVRALYVFGSRATGEARPDSDLDIGVLYRSPTPLEAPLSLEEAIHRATGLNADVTDVARAGAFVALEIVRGERVVARDPVEVDRFELYVLRRAGDLLPFERQRRAMLLSPGP